MATRTACVLGPRRVSTRRISKHLGGADKVFRVMSMVMIVFDIAVFLEERSDYLRAIEPEEEALTTDIEAFYRDED